MTKKGTGNIDDLLAEMDAAMDYPVSKSRPVANPPKPAQTTSTSYEKPNISPIKPAVSKPIEVAPKPGSEPHRFLKTKQKKEDNLDSLLKDIAAAVELDSDEEVKRDAVPTQIKDEPEKRATFTASEPKSLLPSPPMAQSTTAKKIKCVNPLLSPENAEFSPSHRRICQNLRCMKCDRKIQIFHGQKWDPSTDYLFIRNFSIDPNTLKTKMIPSRNSAAFCCQCGWKSIDEPTELSEITELRWMCFGHTSDETF